MLYLQIENEKSAINRFLQDLTGNLKTNNHGCICKQEIRKKETSRKLQCLPLKSSRLIFRVSILRIADRSLLLK